MITKEQLNKKINEEIKAYDEHLLEFEKEELIENAYNIAETHEFYNFISGCIDNEDDSSCIKELCSAVDEETEILASLCEFEMNYDEPMWGNWYDIEVVIRDFTNENK